MLGAIRYKYIVKTPARAQQSISKQQGGGNNKSNFGSKHGLADGV